MPDTLLYFVNMADRYREPIKKTIIELGNKLALVRIVELTVLSFRKISGRLLQQGRTREKAR